MTRAPSCCATGFAASVHCLPATRASRCGTKTCSCVPASPGSRRTRQWGASWLGCYAWFVAAAGAAGSSYVSQVPGIGNPRFNNEPAYAGLRFPDAGYQLLALYRFWNIVEYWFPYRDLLDGDWDRVLAEFVPRVALAADKDAYQLEIIQLIARANDTHANLWSAPPQLRPPAGDCQLPVAIRFLENQAVVTGYSDAATGPATDLRVGDVIERLDGVPVAELLVRWEPFYPASNRPTRLRDIARAMTRGPCVRPAPWLAVRQGGADHRTATAAGERGPASRPDGTILPGDAFRLLSDEVAYLKLSSVQVAQVSSYVERPRKRREGSIIDIRNYPSEFVVFALGSLLVDRPTPFARFTIGRPDHPGAFRWNIRSSSPRQQPHYAGKVVILVDEVSRVRPNTRRWLSGPVRGRW